MAGVNVVGDLEPVSPRPMLEPLEHVNHHPSNVDLGEDGAFKEDNPTSGYNTEKSKGGSTNTFSVGHIEVPDGGHRAWLVVLGGFINFTIGFGLLNSFGIFQARYEHEWGLDTSTITWIGSVQLFLLFLGGIVVGPAFDRWGARPLMLLGTFVCLCSFICTSFSSKFYHYLLAQGFLFGIGNSLLFYPATSAISEWFNKRRALALGMAVSGSSAGGILWPLVVNKLFTVVSEPWVHRINALISIPLLLVACYLVQERKGVAGHDTAGNEIKPSQTSFSKAILDWRFFLLSVALFFIYCGMLVPFYYIPLYAEIHGVSITMSNNLLAIAYSGSVCGRVGTGWIADHVGRFNILFLMALLTSAITISWTWMTSFPAMVVFAIFFGLFSGGLVPLGSACVAQTTPDMGHIGLRIGTMMAFCSFGALAGGPISGAIKDHTHNWVGAFAFSSACSVTGAVLLLVVRFLWQPRWNVIF